MEEATFYQKGLQGWERTGEYRIPKPGEFVEYNGDVHFRPPRRKTWYAERHILVRSNKSMVAPDTLWEETHTYDT